MKARNQSLRIGALAIAPGVLLPSLALACPLCFAASGSRAYLAYYISTVLLSTMPFALIGAVIGTAYLLRNRRHGARERQAAE